MQYLILPRDGDTPCDKLVVKVVIGGVEVHAFDGGELLDVQDIFAVDSSRLPGGDAQKEKKKREEWERSMRQRQKKPNLDETEVQSALIYGHTMLPPVRPHVPGIPPATLFSVWSKCPDDLK